MQNLESVFIKEFREAARLSVGGRDIYSVPLPEDCKRWDVSGTEEYLLKDVENNDFAKLNNTVVKRLPRGYVAKKRIVDKVTRKFKTDESGKYILEDCKIPTGSMVVISNKSLQLSYNYWVKCSEDGYGYIDYRINNGDVEYLYIVPKGNLYKVNQTALVISVKNMKNFTGRGFTTWENGTVFIHVIPYRPSSSYVGSRVLKTGIGMNYKKEIDVLLGYWQSIGYIPNIQLCGLSNGGNLAIKETVVGYDEGEYIPVESLAVSDREVYGSEENE